MSKIMKGVGPDAPIIVNENGASQSALEHRFDLMPPLAQAVIANILHTGANKYGEGSYLNIAPKDHLNHALTHVNAYLCGDTQDDHAGHAACRMLMWLETLLQEQSISETPQCDLECTRNKCVLAWYDGSCGAKPYGTVAPPFMGKARE